MKEKKRFFGILIGALLVFGLYGTVKASLTDGLVAYYPFDGNCNDESDNGYHLTNHGATLTTDRFGNSKRAYLFNGVSSYLSIPFVSGSGLFPTSGSFSISAWFKTTATKPQAVLGTHHSGVGYGYVVYNNEPRSPSFSGTLDLYTNTGGIENILKSISYPVTNGRWHHAVAIWDAGVHSLYLDGILQAKLATSGNIPYDPSVPFYVGGTPALMAVFSGSIDDIRFYNRVLTLTEIQSLYIDQFSILTEFTSQEVAGSIAVQAPKEHSWKATSSVSWITILTGANGKGNGEVTYQVLPNLNAKQRKGQIIVGGQIYSILQKGSGQ